MLYNILLQVDLDDMIHLCYVNHQSDRICHNQHFIHQSK